jgi:hypothetical protein
MIFWMKGSRMDSFLECIEEYRKQLEKGKIQKAYRGLMDYLADLRTYLTQKYPDYFVSSSTYFGYMDMSYFSFTPRSLKDRGLKIAVVFVHETFKFEIWLAGYNKQIQTKYWKLIQSSGWEKYHLVSTPIGADSIIESSLVNAPDFGDLAALTRQIEVETLKFIEDVEGFLSKHGG